MAFDGSAYDGLTGEPNNRLLRPAALAQALSRYPLFILRLKQDALRMSFSMAAEGPQVVRASSPGRPEERWIMLRQDFDRCKSVASLVDVGLLRTEPQTDVLGRIAAQIRVAFG